MRFGGEPCRSAWHTSSRFLPLQDVPRHVLVLHQAGHARADVGRVDHQAPCRLRNHGLVTFEHPDTGLPPAERERLQAQAEAMSLEDLAQFALGDPEKLKDTLGAVVQRAGARSSRPPAA